jgi:bifunctional DNA primase/polymerase-like protein
VNELGAAAVACAERGWHVVPIVPMRKVPVTRNGFLEASTALGLVGAWWEEFPRANIGVAYGPSGLLVVDVDGAEAMHAWDGLVVRHGGHPADTDRPDEQGRPHLRLAVAETRRRTS